MLREKINNHFASGKSCVGLSLMGQFFFFRGPPHLGPKRSMIAHIHL